MREFHFFTSADSKEKPPFNITVTWKSTEYEIKHTKDDILP